MEALSSFGFTDSAKAAVPDTDVLEARMAVNEVKKELESFQGKVSTDVKDVKKEGDEKKDKGYFDFGGIGSMLGLGGGSSDAAPSEIGDRDSARDSVIILTVSDNKELDELTAVPFFVGGHKFMKGQLSEIDEKGGYVKDLLNYFVTSTEKSDSDDLKEFLGGLAAYIREDDAELSEKAKKVIGDDLKDIKHLSVLKKTDDVDTFSLEEAIEKFVNQDAKTQEYFASINLKLTGGTNSSGRISSLGSRTGTKTVVAATSTNRGFFGLIMMFLIMIVALLAPEYMNAAQREKRNIKKLNELVKDNSKQIESVIEHGLLDNRYLQDDFWRQVVATTGTEYAKVAEKDNLIEEVKVAMQTTNDDKQAAIEKVATKYVLESDSSLAIKENPYKVRLGNYLLNANFNQFITTLTGLLRWYDPESEDSPSPSPTPTSTSSVSPPPSYSLNAFINMTLEDKTKLLLESDKFMESVVCQTQIPQLIILFAAAREAYKDLLPKPGPLTVSSSVGNYTVHFHHGCSELENVVNMNMTDDDDDNDKEEVDKQEDVRAAIEKLQGRKPRPKRRSTDDDAGTPVKKVNTMNTQDAPLPYPGADSGMQQYVRDQRIKKMASLNNYLDYSSMV